MLATLYRLPDGMLGRMVQALSECGALVYNPPNPSRNLNLGLRLGIPVLTNRDPLLQVFRLDLLHP
jgi:hypothetical protein